MAKSVSVFICENCGVKVSKWIGKCPSCNQWNTISEELEHKSSRDLTKKKTKENKPQLISELKLSDERRINTHNHEINRVLGGGLVPGSLVLIGGEPGIGKSTLMLQIALGMKEKTVLYVSGEESNQQLKLRADRVNPTENKCYVLSETSLEKVFLELERLAPSVLVIDSIQTLYTDRADSAPGSITQVRECTFSLMEYAKNSSVPVFLIGHINKEGNLAGPKVLEHIVDTVLLFEGDTNNMYRIIRATKNRFGSTSELAIFEMQESGLREVENPSELLLAHQNKKASGTAIAASLNGSRPLLIEVQSLISTAVYGTPQRSSTGFDLRRLNMLLAVLEKKAGFRLSVKDVFLNIAGGLKVDDPGIDLAVICAILSSDQDINISEDICFTGEVGLSGEVRPVGRINARVAEAEKLGFNQIFVSVFNKKGFDLKKHKIQINWVTKVEDVFNLIFG